eukprot:scaffold89587_cov14-Prasinocladus_malaysianus.AAC.1
MTTMTTQRWMKMVTVDSVIQPPRSALHTMHQSLQAGGESDHTEVVKLEWAKSLQYSWPWPPTYNL